MEPNCCKCRSRTRGSALRNKTTTSCSSCSGSCKMPTKWTQTGSDSAWLSRSSWSKSLEGPCGSTLKKTLAPPSRLPSICTQKKISSQKAIFLERRNRKQSLISMSMTWIGQKLEARASLTLCQTDFSARPMNKWWSKLKKKMDWEVKIPVTALRKRQLDQRTTPKRVSWLSTTKTTMSKPWRLSWPASKLIPKWSVQPLSTATRPMTRS